MNSSIFPAVFACMSAEERQEICESIERQRQTADRLQLLKLDIALKSMQEIWKENPAPEKRSVNHDRGTMEIQDKKAM